MDNKENTKKQMRKQIIYDTSDSDEITTSVVAEPAFEYTAPCPKCDRRVFDSTGITGNPVFVRLKCPHCRKIVSIPLSSSQ